MCSFILRGLLWARQKFIVRPIWRALSSIYFYGSFSYSSLVYESVVLKFYFIDQFIFNFECMKIEHPKTDFCHTTYCFLSSGVRKLVIR